MGAKGKPGKKEEKVSYKKIYLCRKKKITLEYPLMRFLSRLSLKPNKRLVTI